MSRELIDRHTGRTTGYRYSSREMSGPLPPVLYKYLKVEHAQAMVERGDLMFSTLSWFQNEEDPARGDEFEGRHKYFPIGGLEITRIERDGEPHPPVKVMRPNDSLQSRAKGADHIFIYSTSIERGLMHFDDPTAPACVEIHSPAKFLARLRAVLNLTPRAKVATLIHDRVSYYSFADPPGNVYALPHRLTMHKREDEFRRDHEYRFAFGTRREVFDFEHVEWHLVQDGARQRRRSLDPAEHRWALRVGSLAHCCRPV